MDENFVKIGINYISIASINGYRSKKNLYTISLFDVWKLQAYLNLFIDCKLNPDNSLILDINIKSEKDIKLFFEELDIF